MERRNKNMEDMNAIIKSLEGKVDAKFSSLDNTLDTQFTKLNDSYNSLKLEIQTLSGRVSPIEHDLNNKVSLETHTALERRVAKIEDAPNGIRSNVGLIISGVGCLSAIVFSIIGTALTILFFILTNMN